MIDKILWQPYGLKPSKNATNPYDFSIYLDWEFANKMMQNKILESKQFRFNKAIGEIYGFQLPLQFHENTSLLESINLGMNGRWLNLDNSERKKLDQNKKEPLQFYSHNIDNSTDQLNLLKIFESWINYHPSLLAD
ncbi:MAG: hypothetical protein KC516_02375 [Nanoarchaeota archaeon]|nr:hypothetical protein [Nanoarchaeota archaeon]